MRTPLVQTGVAVVGAGWEKVRVGVWVCVGGDGDGEGVTDTMD